MELAIVGLGGVGGYFGYKLAQRYAGDNKLAVTFIARDPTYSVIKQQGLTLLSPECYKEGVWPARLLSKPSELSVVDTVLICVKEYDLERVCEQIKNKMTERSVIIPLMNGVDIYERIRRIVPNGIVLPACVYIASHIKEKGVVEHRGEPGKIILGKDPQHPEFSPDQLLATLENAKIDVAFKSDAFPDIWMKFFFIAPFGLVSARHNRSIGEVNSNPELQKRARAIMEEIEAIAYGKGIPLPKDIISRSFSKAGLFPFHTPTSLQLDVQSGKPDNELGLFGETIIRYGKELGITVPETERVTKEIKEILGRG